ncbi:MAG: RNA polymerase subunit sigma-70 [Planctomycetes bacterium]|nr:RNA polymerase subunit sigma-70 [Planctomycetota bacterium]
MNSYSSDGDPPEGSDPSAVRPFAEFPPIPPDEELKELFSELFLQLHNQARRSMGGDSAGHTLQPTALVSEAYLRLQKSGSSQWDNRDQFLLIAARAMRCVLVDHFRAKFALKRGGNKADLDVELIAAPFEELSLDLDALDLALTKLEKSEPQMAQAVQLRFFVGTSMDEVARLLGMPLRTLERRMTIVRAWLHTEISK